MAKRNLALAHALLFSSRVLRLTALSPSGYELVHVAVSHHPTARCPLKIQRHVSHASVSILGKRFI